MLLKFLTLLFPPTILDCDLLPLDIQQEEFSDNFFLVTFFDYKNEQVKNLILTLKENESPELLTNLAKIISESLVKQISNKKIYFVPIPARKQRLEEFGFNQCELFCNALSKFIPHSKTIPLVYRTKEISKQARKNKSQREQEINHTMNYKQKIPEDVSRNSLFIIVDDVTTTGSTLKEASRVLELAGAQEILLMSLARA
jgi:ComF family protein